MSRFFCRVRQQMMEVFQNLHSGFHYWFSQVLFCIYHGRTQTMKCYFIDDVFSIDSACFGKVEPMQVSDLILYRVCRRLLSN